MGIFSALFGGGGSSSSTTSTTTNNDNRIGVGDSGQAVSVDGENNIVKVTDQGVIKEGLATVEEILGQTLKEQSAVTKRSQQAALEAQNKLASYVSSSNDQVASTRLMMLTLAGGLAVTGVYFWRRGR
jgi:hypothetical protein